MEEREREVEIDKMKKINKLRYIIYELKFHF